MQQKIVKKKKEDLFINTYLLKFSIIRKVNIRRIIMKI